MDRPDDRKDLRLFIKGVTGGADASIFSFPGYPPCQLALLLGGGRLSVTMTMAPSPLEGTVRPLTKLQLKGVDLRAEGNSWDQIAKKCEVHPRTIHRWRDHPLWKETLDRRKKEWVEEYETAFTRMMPRVAYRHAELLDSQSEAIKMRAVDSAHSNHVRCVRENETKSEVEALKEMVLALCEQLAQQRAAG